MTHPLRTTAEDLVAALCSLKRDPITLGKVTGLLKSTPVSKEALEPYIWWSDERYTRNLIYRDEMTVPQGNVTVQNFRHVSCNAPENQNVVGLDCLGGATQLTLERTEESQWAGSGSVATVDKTHTIHRIANQEADDDAISLHIYSKPFDSCIAFDLENQRCFRRTLSYYSRFGRVET
jgi:cysteine dioxygenase